MFNNNNNNNNNNKEDEDLELVKLINSTFLFKYDLIFKYIKNRQPVNFGYIGTKNFESNGLFLIFKLINERTKANFNIKEFYVALFSNYNHLFNDHNLVVLSIIKSANIKVLEMYLELNGSNSIATSISTSISNSGVPSTTKLPTPSKISTFNIKSTIEQYYSTLGFRITDYKEFKYFNYLQKRFQNEFPTQLVLKCSDFGCFNNPLYKLKHLIRSNLFINYAKQFNQVIEMDCISVSSSSASYFAYQLSIYEELFTFQQLNSDLLKVLKEFTYSNINNHNNSSSSSNNNNKNNSNSKNNSTDNSNSLNKHQNQSQNHFQFKEFILTLIYNYYSIIPNKPFEYNLLFSNDERVIKECKNQKFYNYEIFLNFRYQESDSSYITTSNKLKKLKL